ncbi:outer membrane beta-barrel protein [Litoribacter alkaliphilus]|uniref:Outer membrane beta-barrel protein n=1 Tax=Litoribacter ruber TaxID=702568 RepID=A0AAP2CH09_9BACT|nr:outer membrane beta-barrel protein [Litoribacter alkaliphilus]MBS9522465.1 outer membrane beta-barrel protein [Litoribacter alkaliphilus]
MKDQFDKRLAEKIKSSFDDYHEEVDPREWEKFSDAFFASEKPKRFLLWPWLVAGMAAACLALGVILYPLLYGNEAAPLVAEWTNPSSKPPKITEESAIEQKETGAEENVGQSNTIASPKVENLQEARTKESSVITEEPQPKIVIPQAMVAQAEVSTSSEQIFTPSTIALVPEGLPELGGFELPSRTLAFGKVAERNFGGMEDNLATNLIVATEVEEKKINPIMTEEDAKRKLQDWSMADAAEIEKKKDTNPMRLGVLVAPQSNSNTSMGLNLGAGVVSEIPLSKRLKVDVGVTYARQSMIPQQNQQLMMVSAAHSGNDGLNRNSMQTMAFSAASTATPSPRNYELNIANLDIPINLKYKVMDKPQAGLYVISGLSSMVYLNQTTVESYTQPSFGFGPQGSAADAVISNELTPEGGEGGVDLGRMLNLSFGYEHSLTNGTFLSIEPFYKMPLGNMTFIDQQFSIGGVNLRMNFQFRK